jgi:hypothetical protein
VYCGALNNITKEPAPIPTTDNVAFVSDDSSADAVEDLIAKDSGVRGSSSSTDTNAVGVASSEPANTIEALCMGFDWCSKEAWRSVAAEGAAKARVHCSKFVIKDAVVHVPWPNGDHMPLAEVTPADLSDMMSSMTATKPPSFITSSPYETDGWSTVNVARRSKETIYTLQLMDPDNNTKQICQVLVHHFAPPKTVDFTDAHREHALELATQLARDLSKGTLTVDDITCEKNMRIAAWQKENGLSKNSGARSGGVDGGSTTKSGGTTDNSTTTRVEKTVPEASQGVSVGFEWQRCRNVAGDNGGEKRSLDVASGADAQADQPEAKRIHWSDPLSTTMGYAAPREESTSEEAAVGRPADAAGEELQSVAAAAVAVIAIGALSIEPCS